MIRYHLALPAAAALLLSACAVDPATYGSRAEPRQAPQQTTPRTSATAQEGKIAACNHPGASEAQVEYPDGWYERLNEAPETGTSSSGGELLGGPSVIEVTARDAKPIRPPSVSYPSGPASRGIEAQCYALMDVDVSGQPERIQTACSSPAFNAATYQAAAQMRFAPRTRDGADIRRINVVYPITFCRDGAGETSRRDSRY